MGNHSRSKVEERSIRISGYRAIQHLESLELVANRFNSSWPKLANRLQSLGFLRGIQVLSNRTSLFVSLDVETVQGIIAGRARRKKVPKWIGFGAAIPVLAALAFVPLGSSAPIQHHANAHKHDLDPCALDSISEWIQGAGESAEIKSLSASLLGGITVGTLECNGSRYSYTLGSEEPKRVLKLQKLDA